MKNTVNIFLYGSLRMGGIETLLTRVSKFMLEKNYRFHLALSDPAANDSILSSGIDFVPLFDEELKLSSNIRRIIDENLGSHFRLVSFDSGSAAMASILELYINRTGEDCSHITGFFHPEAYFMQGEVWSRKVLNWIIGRCFSEDSMFFMNDETLRSHSKFFKIKLERASIIHLPLASSTRSKFIVRSSSLKILTIGRLVQFKAYNLGIPKMVRNLLDRGISVYWDVYGDGPLASQIMELSLSEGTQDHINLKGTVAYEAIPDMFLAYDLFVGQGTSALEAAQHGLPAICPIIHSLSGAYGFIHDLPLGNVGEIIYGNEEKEIPALIDRYISLDILEKRLLSLNGINYAKSYSMEEFLKRIGNMAANPSSYIALRVRYVIGLFLINLHHYGESSVKLLLSKKIFNLFSMKRSR